MMLFTWGSVNRVDSAVLASSASSLKVVSERGNSNEMRNEVGRLSFLPDGIKNSIASGTATAIVKIVLQPLDVIKTIQQSKPNVKLGPFRAAVEVIRERGILGLWSGIGISVK